MLKIAKHFSLLMRLTGAMGLQCRHRVEEGALEEKQAALQTSFPWSGPALLLLLQVAGAILVWPPFHDNSSKYLFNEIPANKWGLSGTWRWLKQRVWGSLEAFGFLWAGVLYIGAASKFLYTAKHSFLLSLKKTLALTCWGPVTQKYLHPDQHGLVSCGGERNPLPF